MSVKIIECPRDAMQGIHDFIDTDLKISYINQLLKVGFDTLDCGSFVSPKAIPQLKDTAEVLNNVDLDSTNTKLLTIIANTKGADIAKDFEQVKYLGFPFSISETFQQRNTNSSIEDSFGTVEYIQNVCSKTNKELVLYVSMGFGNPYGDPWSAEVVEHWVSKLHNLGIRIFALSDTVGGGNPENISYLFKNLIPAYPDSEFGAHLHTRPDNWKEKVEAAYNNGCQRFDGAIKGFGGCPMAEDELVGNMPTERLLEFFDAQLPQINKPDFEMSMAMASKVFA